MSQDETPPKNSKVGYKTPPVEHQFQPGQSGNPGGRPLGSKNKPKDNLNGYEQILLEEAYREIEVGQPSGPVTMTVMQAATRMLGVKSMKGDTKSTKYFLDKIGKIESDRKSEKNQVIEKAVKYKKRWPQDLELYTLNMCPLYVILPHADHVKIDYETGEVTREGPMDNDELIAWQVKIETIAKLEVELLDENKRYLQDCADTSISREWLQKFRQKIPKHDPWWLMFGPDRKSLWIDYYYFYAPEPEKWPLGAKPVDIDYEPSFEHPPVSPEMRVEIDQWQMRNARFQLFMRAKLQELMGEDWDSRLDAATFRARDVEMGVFDPDNYEISEDEQDMFRDPAFLEKYMAWD